MKLLTRYSTITVLLVCIFISICTQALAESSVTAPKPYGPVPTERQLRWHKMEYYGLIHYGPNTYTHQGWGYGDTDPSVFDPSDLDTDQWAKAAKDGGMKGLILVAKHHDGFCLWPSKTTEYNISKSPWKDGKGDLVGDFLKSCKKYGLEPGIYISPWDRNHAEYGRAAYVEAFHQQWREILDYDTQLFMCWFDGANGGSGWYGGANGRRKISKGYYQWDKLIKMIRDRQPDTLFFNLWEHTDGVRWIGNEHGGGDSTHWSRMNPLDGLEGKAKKTVLGSGHKDGTIWAPAEADTPLHPGWFRNPNRKQGDLQRVIGNYYGSIGSGAALDLGIGPDERGLFTEHTVKVLKGFKEFMDKLFAINLAGSAEIKSSNYRGKDKKFAPAHLLDDDTDTYWATDDGVKNASFDIKLEKPVDFDHLMLQECIRFGQRIHKFKLERLDGKKWKTVVEGATVGYKRVVKFPSCKTDTLRLTLETDAPCLTLSTFGLYKAPEIKNIVHSDEKLNRKLVKGTIDKASSESDKHKAANLVDGNYGTSWQSGDDTDFPHFITIDLGKSLPVRGLYVVRVKNDEVKVFGYAVYVSNDTSNWGDPVVSGEFGNIKASREGKNFINLGKNTEGRYIKFVCRSGLEEEQKQAALAEIEIVER